MKQIGYKKLQTQPYILSENLTNEEVNNLFAIRSRMIKVKMNFPKQHKDNNLCSLGCKVEEDQRHLLECEIILDKMEDKFSLAELEYSDLFGTLTEQVQIAKAFSNILKIREELLEK